jgi:uncharacterized membrane protein YhaH (DUF805 family)
VNKAPVPLLLPLKHYADFRGRSTRTELIGLYLIVLLANLPVWLIGIDGDARRWVDAGLALLLLCPAIALGVRRLHDSGRSGWWMLLALPWLPATIWEFIVRPDSWRMPAQLHHPWWIMLPVGLCTLALGALLLLDDDVDTNRYGPNPRGWTPPPGEPA